jgi:hypothetical protein
MAASGAMLDATQEMITLGFCNIVGSFVRSMPINGSFTRSAVNNSSGVRTPFGGLYTGIDFNSLDTTQIKNIYLVLYFPKNKG